MTTALAAFAALAACGSPSSSPSRQDTRRYVLAVERIGTGQGFAIATGMVVEAGADASAADFWLRMSTVISLAGATPDQPFCPKGGPFRVVTDVPGDATGCTWTYVDLGGNAPFADDLHAGEGFLLRSGDGAIGGQLLIVSHRVDTSGRAEVTFDFARPRP